MPSRIAVFLWLLTCGAVAATLPPAVELRIKGLAAVGDHRGVARLLETWLNVPISKPGTSSLRWTIRWLARPSILEWPCGCPARRSVGPSLPLCWVSTTQRYSVRNWVTPLRTWYPSGSSASSS